MIAVIPKSGPIWALQRLSRLLAIAALLTGTSCLKKHEQTPDIIILQSGRIRGNIYPTALQNIAPLQHYPYLAGYVKKVREEASRTGAQVFVIDIGDSLSGSFASHATDNGNMITFFNEVGYDAIVLGNLDNNIQPATLEKLKAVVLCPFVAPDGTPATSGAAFGAHLKEGGIAIEVLANFYGDVSREKYPERFPTWFGATPGGVTPLRDYRPVVESLGARLPNTLSLLSWMKFESPKDPPAAFLKTLDQLSIDAILAHRIYSGRERDIWSESTFYDWKPPVSENILRNNGGFTLARLDLKQDGDNWRVLKQELIPMTANTAEADPSLTDRIAQFRKPIEDADKPLGELAEPIPAEAILTGYLAAIAAIPGTDIAAYSRQSIRSDWPEGMLTASRVFNSLPWTTSIVQMTLTPAQLEKLGSLAGIVYLRRKDLPADQAAFVVTTSRFFASLLAEELRMPASEMRATPHKSEFDYFVDALSQAPKPLSFSVPEGWQFVDPRK